MRNTLRMGSPIAYTYLHRLYVQHGYSVADIAQALNCSQNKVNYWMQKCDIPKRNIADAVYRKHNPKGDPFQFNAPKTQHDWYLWGLGLGLYWGEGTKRNQHAVRLGNTDPALVRTFLSFLTRFFSIDTQRLRFGLHIFPDVSHEEAVQHWSKKLDVSHDQFFASYVSKVGSGHTYSGRAPYGVVTVYFTNKKLRDRLVTEIEKLQQVS